MRKTENNQGFYDTEAKHTQNNYKKNQDHKIITIITTLKFMANFLLLIMTQNFYSRRIYHTSNTRKIFFPYVSYISLINKPFLRCIMYNAYKLIIYENKNILLLIKLPKMCL